MNSEPIVIEDGSYEVKEESEATTEPKEPNTTQLNHNGEEMEYKITYHAGEEEQPGQTEVILDGTRIVDDSGQHYIYQQNGGGGNLYVISTVTTGEDGVQQEGQLIATSAELFEAANAVGGAQIVNISNLAELGLATNPSELLEGQQHIIINGQQMILHNGDVMDESYTSNQSFMEQEVVIDSATPMEEEIKEEENPGSSAGKPRNASSRKNTKKVKTPIITTTAAIEAGPPLINLAPLPLTTNSTTTAAPMDFSSYDETISAVVKHSLQLAEQEKLDKERQLQIERIAARAAAPKTLADTTPIRSTPLTLTSRSNGPPQIFTSTPKATAVVTSTNASAPTQAQANRVQASSEPVPVQQHTVIMVKDKRKKMKFHRDPMTLPFSYAGQSFNVQAQKLILNVMHFFKTHKNDEFIDSIKTPQEKAARVLNVSSSVIGKIRKNYKMGRLEHPGKKRAMTKRVLDKVNTFDEEIIRKIINDMVATGMTPTIPMILAEARIKIGFTGSRTSFRRILHRMGYKYGKMDRKIVMLDSDGSEKAIKSEPGSSTPRPPIIPGLGSAVSGTQNSLPALPKLVATKGPYTRPRIQLTPISTTSPSIHLTSLARPPSIQYAPLSRPPNIHLAPLSRPPAQIQVIKQDPTSSVPAPIILNNGSNFVVNNTISQAIQQPRQIIIQQSSSSPSQQQFYTIQPHQLNQITTSSGQPQIIRIIQSNQRAPQTS